MALGDYGDTFNPNPYLDPALGQMLAQDPESLIPHFAAAGVPPPGPQFAANFGPRFDAASPPALGTTNTLVPESPLVPQSGTVGDQNPYAQPPATPAGPPGTIPDWRPDWLRRGVETVFPPSGQPPAAAPPAKTQDRLPQGQKGRVPPTALGQSEPAAPLVPDNRVADEPYTPGYQTASVTGGTGEPTGRTAALPAEDPRKATTDSLSADAAKKAVSAFAGVRAPPPPPQPQLRPFAGERPAAQPTHNQLITLLSQVIQGSPAAANQLRLLQTVGGK